MAEPRQVPVYEVAICDGDGRRDLLVIDDVETPEQAAARRARLATGLRRRGVLGSVVLTDAGTGTIVARRRVWP